MAFHAGVLRRLARTGRLESVGHVSSVSGGTLIMGLVLAANGWTWPSSAQYLEPVASRIRQTLTSRNILAAAVLLALLPQNWRYAFSRANVLAQAIRRCWAIDLQLSELPISPTWSINATTAETGRRFRFKQDRCGDYEIGYADAASFPVSEALAVSAAFPGLVGPFSITANRYTWKNRPWGAPAEIEQPVALPYNTLHLYDGGIYDNLALEPLFDVGKQTLKGAIDFLVCSDAGAPFARTNLSLYAAFRAKRLFDIVMDQARALRIRALSSFLERNPRAGSYAQIGADPRERLRKHEGTNGAHASTLLEYEWLDSAAIKLAAGHGTTLWPLTGEEFDRLERHGYESLSWNECLFLGMASPE